MRTAGEPQLRSGVLRCPDGLPVGVDVHLPAGGDGARLPLVLLCHGFKGFRRWGLFPHLAARLAGGGRAVVSLDLSHNGTAPGSEEDFTRLDLFAAQTLSRGLDDLTVVLDGLQAGRLPGLPARESGPRAGVHLVGHSLGGGLALLLAARDRRVASVAALNGVGHFRRIGAEGLAQLREQGHVDIPNARTGQTMRLGQAWFDDLERHDLERACRALAVPALVVVGGADTSVPPEESRWLAGWIAGARLVEVPGADHVFDARHPWQGWTPSLEAAAAALEDFLPREELP